MSYLNATFSQQFCFRMSNNTFTANLVVMEDCRATLTVHSLVEARSNTVKELLSWLSTTTQSKESKNFNTRDAAGFPNRVCQARHHMIL